ncbi:UNVERIFIED_ORG: hypothetical protein LHK14_17880 [Roseateles sp. XES5]|nr:hypothetical protein [Roseateles sp. XES5]
MALLTCADCSGSVSSSAVACVHCGNVLQERRPGVIGTVLRVLYGLFCVALLVIGVVAVRDVASGAMRPSEVLFVPLVLFGIWFAGSAAIAVLLYVTRHGRVVRLESAVKR